MATDPLAFEERPVSLRRPVLLLAFSGWNDAAEAATNAARHLCRAWGGRRFAVIDPEEFMHFGLSRPLVRLKPGTTEREIVWPSTEFFVCDTPGLARDVLIGLGIEPHLRWRSYCRMIVELARQCDVGLVLTLGALLAEVPHTRPIRLTGYATDPELSALLGVRPTRYEGPTGIVGVLGSTCRQEGLTTASLWANVPHYISAVENPKATLALLQRVLRLLDAELDLRELEEAGAQFDAQLDAVVAKNRKVANYVKQLEAKERESLEEAPLESPGELPDASELVAEIERFLREQPPSEGGERA